MVSSWLLFLATKTLSHKGFTKDFQNLITTSNQNNLTVKAILYLFFRLFGSKMTIPIPNSFGSQVIRIRMKLPVSEDTPNNDLNFNILPISPILFCITDYNLASLGAFPFVNGEYHKRPKQLHGKCFTSIVIFRVTEKH